MIQTGLKEQTKYKSYKKFKKKEQILVIYAQIVDGF